MDVFRSNEHVFISRFQGEFDDVANGKNGIRFEFYLHFFFHPHIPMVVSGRENNTTFELNVKKILAAFICSALLYFRSNF